MIKHIRLTSDIHNEFCHPSNLADHFKYILPPLDTDQDSVLVVAGDFCNFNLPYSYINFINYIKDKFAEIIMIAGNHEWYNGIYTQSERQFKEFIASCKNIHYLSGTKGKKSMVIIDHLQFVGNTLWTDFNKSDDATMRESKRFMNDYNLIQLATDPDKLAKTLYHPYILPVDILAIHKEELHKIEYHLKRNKGFKQVVVTHHGPSMDHIHPKYANEGLTNYAFTSDLKDLILKYQPEYWFSGHTHESIDVTFGKTRCLVNPVGYKNRYMAIYENLDYNPRLVLEV